MIVYTESSAVLARLLGESNADRGQQTLAGAERVVTSAITAAECGRAIGRGLHALHLATAGLFQQGLGRLTMLSFDDRIRANAEALGIDVDAS